MTNTYCVYTVLRYSWWWTMDLSETCSVLYQINVRNSASRWFSLQEYITMHGPLNVRLKWGVVSVHLPSCPFLHSTYSRYIDDEHYRMSRINILCKSSLGPWEEPRLSHPVKLLYSNGVHAPLVLQIHVSAPVCPLGLRCKEITGDITDNCHILLQGVCCS